MKPDQIKFERWAKEQKDNMFPTAKNCYGTYINLSTWSAWKGWKAANKQLDKEIRGDITKDIDYRAEDID